MGDKVTRVTLSNKDLFWIMEWRAQCTPNEADMGPDELKTAQKLDRAWDRLS